MAQELSRSAELAPVEARVGGLTDVLWAAHMAKEFACAVGFAALSCDEIGLVVTELSSNLVRHAKGGSIRVSEIFEGARTGIEIQSTDQGPGIANVELALTDGYSTAGGLGLGLGTVKRLTETVGISSLAKGGTRVVCQRWLHTQTSGLTMHSVLAFGAATRSFGDRPENGDTFLFKEWGQSALVGVIDGLGHGPFAQLAAQTARCYVEQHFDEPLDQLFQGANGACRATRGVVMALARVDLPERRMRLASVGNVEVRLMGNSEPFSPVMRRGIVGMNTVKAQTTEHAWTSSSFLIMHSDGLKKDWHWTESEYRLEMSRTPIMIAQQLLHELARVDDDATVVVARSAK